MRFIVWLRNVRSVLGIMNRQLKKAVGVLPKPIKPLKRIASDDVVSVIRKSRGSGKKFGRLSTSPPSSCL